MHNDKKEIATEKEHKKNITAKDFLSKIIGFSIATWIGAALSFLATPFVTRIFEPSEVGKINLFFTYLTVLQYVGILGLNQAYIRFFNEPIGKNDKNGLFKVCVALSISLSLIVSVGVIICSNVISTEISSVANFKITLCLVICLITNVFLTLSNTYYRMENKVLLFSIQAVSITIAGKLSYIVAAIWTPKHTIAIYIMTFCYTIIFLFFSILQLQSKKNYKMYFGEKEVLPLLKYSLPLIPVMLMVWINTSIPILVLKKLEDYSAIGIYSSAITIVGIITLLQSGFNIFWSPFVYENYKTNSRKIVIVHEQITLWMVMLGLLTLLGQDAIYLIVGERFREGKEFFAFLLVSPICYTIAETTGLGINISKKSYLNLIVTGISAAINIIMCYMLVPIYGITGASMAVAISSVIMLVVKTLIGERFYKCINNYIKSISAPLIFVIVAICNYAYTNQQMYRYMSVIVGMIILCVIFKKEILYLLKQGKIIIKVL